VPKHLGAIPWERFAAAGDEAILNLPFRRDRPRTFRGAGLTEPGLQMPLA